MILDNEIFSLLMTQVAASNNVQHLLWMQATAHNFLFSLTDAAAGASSCLESQYSKFMRLTSHTHYTQITAENKTLTQHICMLTCDNNYTEIFISYFQQRQDSQWFLFSKDKVPRQTFAFILDPVCSENKSFEI